MSDLDKSSAAVRDMFAGVAPRYDFLNHLLSASLDRRWRRQASAALGLPPGSRVLDLCCGTGDQAIAAAAAGYRVVAGDFCLPMLARAEAKYAARARRGGGAPAGLAADSLTLPFADRSFDGAMVSFGLRNVEDLGRALAEIRRVLRPSGRLVALEFTLPERALLRRPYLFYFERVLPAIGRLVSPRGAAYGYLRDSVFDFPQRAELTRRMLAAGFAAGGWRDLSGGTVCLYQAVA